MTEEKLEEMAKEFKKAKDDYVQFRNEEYNELVKFLKEKLENDNQLELKTDNLYTKDNIVLPYISLESKDNNDIKFDITFDMQEQDPNSLNNHILYDRIGIFVKYNNERLHKKLLELNSKENKDDKEVENINEEVNYIISNRCTNDKYDSYQLEVMTGFELPLTNAYHQAILELIRKLSEFITIENDSRSHCIDQLKTYFNLCNKIENRYNKKDKYKDAYNGYRNVQRKNMFEYLKENISLFEWYKEDSKISISQGSAKYTSLRKLNPKYNNKNWKWISIENKDNNVDVIISLNMLEKMEDGRWKSYYDRIGIIIKCDWVEKGDVTNDGNRTEGANLKNKTNKDKVQYMYMIENEDAEGYKKEIMTNIDLPLKKDDMQAIVNIIKTEVDINN